MPTDVLSLRLLGPMCVLQAGHRVKLPASRKARCLLAYLAMAQRPLLRTRLCEVFWEMPNDPRGELRWCLSKLRRVLDDGATKRVRADKDAVAIDTSQLEIDALVVEREADAALAGTDIAWLERLAGLAGEAFLDGMDSERDPLFQVWLGNQRARFQSLHDKLQYRIVDLLPDMSEGRLTILRRLAERRPDDMASQQAFLTELARMGRLVEGDAHVVAMVRVLKSAGLLAGPLERAWQAVRQRVPAIPLPLDPGHLGPMPALAPAEPSPPPRAESERRQLTALQCDFDCSSQGASSPDPEDLLEALSAFGLHCQEAIACFGGSIAARTSDGILAYFGYPEGFEDSAARALHGALRIVRHRGDVVSGFAVRVASKVGIATGFVVIKPPVQAGDPSGVVVFGDTPKLAMALRTAAGAGEILIADATRRLVGQTFALAAPALKVRAGETETFAWLVLGVDDRRGRFEAHHGEGVSPLVGRGEEMLLLKRRWDDCVRGEGQVAILSGEAGIGKSRLVLALQEATAGVPRRTFVLFGSPLHQATMLHPFKIALHKAAGIKPDDGPGRRWERLADHMQGLPGDSSDDLPCLAELLSIPERLCPRLDLSPEKRRDITLAALIRHVEMAAAHEPLLLVVEDIHWIDPTSLEVISLIVDRSRCLRMMMVITGRPEFRSPWTGHPDVTMLMMNRLRRREGAALIQHVAGDAVLPPALIDEIVLKTDGIPLFIEEVTKAALRSDEPIGERDAFAKGAPKQAITVPVSVQDSLTARLDRLGEGRICAQSGAVIGREFSYRLLFGISEGEGLRLDEGLSRLERAQLVSCRGTPPLATYTFRHALVQEAAAASLLPRQRQSIHRRIAEHLRDHPDDVGTGEPEVIAHHFRQAGRLDEAVVWLGRAGQAALQASACLEAISLFEDAMVIAASRPETPEGWRERLRLQTSYASFPDNISSVRPKAPSSFFTIAS